MLNLNYIKNISLKVEFASQPIWYTNSKLSQSEELLVIFEPKNNLL